MRLREASDFRGPRGRQASPYAPGTERPQSPSVCALPFESEKMFIAFKLFKIFPSPRKHEFSPTLVYPWLLLFVFVFRAGTRKRLTSREPLRERVRGKKNVLSVCELQTARNTSNAMINLRQTQLSAGRIIRPRDVISRRDEEHEAGGGRDVGWFGFRAATYRTGHGWSWRILTRSCARAGERARGGGENR